jgi:hypothetical protein
LEKKLNQAIQLRALPRPLPGNFVRAGRSDGGGILNYMVKPKLDKFREARIAMEIVVDCYNQVECFGGWFWYLEEKLEFPFRARCVTRREVSPLKKGEEVEVIGMLDEGWDNPSEILVRIKWQGRKLSVPLAQLEGIGVNGLAAEAIADWHYWSAQGYCF